LGLTSFTPANYFTGVPYTDLIFYLDGNPIDIKLNLTGVNSQSDLNTAMMNAVTAAVAANPALAGLTLTDNPGALQITTTDGLEQRTFDTFTLSDPGHTLSISTPPGQTVVAGWNVLNGLPANNAFAASISPFSNTTEALITSSILLDYVGRTNMGGDLVVGGLSIGSTDNCQGVERFDITVDRVSELQTINSTNNKLREVSIVDGTGFTGGLTVTGVVTTPSSNVSSGGVDVNQALPGTVLDPSSITGNLSNISGDQYHAGFGFTDVRIIDAHTFVGPLDATLSLDFSVVAKFMTMTNDTVSNPGDDQTLYTLNNNNVNFGIGPNAFQYLLGSGNSTFGLQIDSHNLDAAGNAGIEDFNLLIQGGAGTDHINTEILNAYSITSNAIGQGTDADHWYMNQKTNANLIIDAGNGAGTTVSTYGAGDWQIHLGTGSDTVYLDNSGVYGGGFCGYTGTPGKAEWVFNTADQNGSSLGTYTSSLTDNNFLTGPDFNQLDLFKTHLTVTYMGLNASIVLNHGANGYTSDEQLNQAIEQTINNDPVLSKLIKASDGPGETLIVKALTDGFHTVNDLAISITADTLLPSDVTAYNAAHHLTGVSALTGAQIATSEAATIANLLNIANETANYGNYESAFAVVSTYDSTLHQYIQTGGPLTGADSANNADNHVYSATGNNVIVLGTDHTAAGFIVVNGTTYDSTSNDTIIYNALNNTGHNDTIVNFVTSTTAVDVSGSSWVGNPNATPGVDSLDFTVLGGHGADFVNDGLASLDTAGSIAVQNLITSGVGANSTVAQIAALYTGIAATATDHILITVNGNTGTAWQVIEGTVAGHDIVNLIGTITLATGNIDAGNIPYGGWANVHHANFVV
jgi:hypothetical protein